MNTNSELIQILQSILDTKDQTRAQLIKEFQEEIWDGENLYDEELNQLLLQLAYDLDFYEPNEDWRKESPNYYGDNKLEKEISSILKKLIYFETN